VGRCWVSLEGDGGWKATSYPTKWYAEREREKRKGSGECGQGRREGGRKDENEEEGKRQRGSEEARKRGS